MEFEALITDLRQIDGVKGELEMRLATRWGEIPDQPSPKSRRYRLRLSVRALMILLLVVGGGLGWIVRNARVQREAVAVIKKAGGSVRYDWERKNGKPIPNAGPWAPSWLVNYIGVDYFGNVVSASLREWGSDTELVHLAQLTRLERLSFIGCIYVTDTGLANLKGLTGLRALDLCHTGVGDAGLAHLKGLNRLENLTLDSSAFTDEGLANLKGLTGLQSLDLINTRVTGEGLANLKGMTGLKGLFLYHTYVNDAGLSYLKGLTSLRELGLGYTRISDAGLANLKALTSLRELDIKWTRITEAGVKELGEALPQARIVR